MEKTRNEIHLTLKDLNILLTQAYQNKDPIATEQFRETLSKLIMLCAQSIHELSTEEIFEIIKLAKQTDPKGLGIEASERLFEPAIQLHTALDKVTEPGIVNRISGAFDIAKCFAMYGMKNLKQSNDAYFNRAIEGVVEKGAT